MITYFQCPGYGHDDGHGHDGDGHDDVSFEISLNKNLENKWGGENRRVYRWNFNPPPNFGGLIPFLFLILRFQLSGMMDRDADT
jgi:hypothetical protein